MSVPAPGRAQECCAGLGPDDRVGAYGPSAPRQGGCVETVAGELPPAPGQGGDGGLFPSHPRPAPICAVLSGAALLPIRAVLPLAQPAPQSEGIAVYGGLSPVKGFFADRFPGRKERGRVGWPPREPPGRVVRWVGCNVCPRCGESEGVLHGAGSGRPGGSFRPGRIPGRGGCVETVAGELRPAPGPGVVQGPGTFPQPPPPPLPIRAVLLGAALLPIRTVSLGRYPPAGAAEIAVYGGLSPVRSFFAGRFRGRKERGLGRDCRRGNRPDAGCGGWVAMSVPVVGRARECCTGLGPDDGVEAFGPTASPAGVAS